MANPSSEARSAVGLCLVCGREPTPPCPHQGVEAGSMRCLDCGKRVEHSDPVFARGAIPSNPCRRGHYADGAVWEAECYRLGYERQRAGVARLGAERDAASAWLAHCQGWIVWRPGFNQSGPVALERIRAALRPEGAAPLAEGKGEGKL